LKLNYHVPEFLPIQGKRARVYYHGIPSFCAKCYRVGHLKPDCKNSSATWYIKISDCPLNLSITTLLTNPPRFDYIRRLRDAGVEDSLFGNWLDSNHTPGPVVLKNVQQPIIERDTPPVVPNTPAVDFDFEQGAKLITCLQGLLESGKKIQVAAAAQADRVDDKKLDNRSKFNNNSRGRGRKNFYNDRGQKRRLSEGDKAESAGKKPQPKK